MRRLPPLDREPAAGVVVIEATDEARAHAVRVLAKLGYPAKGSVEGSQAAAAAAKSFVSCAVGRMSA